MRSGYRSCCSCGDGSHLIAHLCFWHFTSIIFFYFFEGTLIHSPPWEGRDQREFGWLETEPHLDVVAPKPGSDQVDMEILYHIGRGYLASSRGQFIGHGTFMGGSQISLLRLTCSDQLQCLLPGIEGIALLLKMSLDKRPCPGECTTNDRTGRAAPGVPKI